MQFTKIATFVIALIALIALAGPAAAQQDRPGRDRPDRARQQMEPEQAKAAWSWQAKAVGREMGLDDAATEQLVAAYVKSRNELAEATRKAREQAREKARASEGGDGRDIADGDRRRRFRGADPKVLADARAGFRKSLATFLTPEQVEQAGKSLGVFNPQWDLMVNAIAGFELETDQTFAALAPVQAFMIEMMELRESGDFTMMREEMSAAREELNAALAAVLTDEQLETFKEKTSRRRGRGNRQRGNDRVPSGGI